MSFEEFAEKIRVRLVAYASSKGVPERAGDIAQETLLVLWTNYGHLDTEGDLVPLAFNICAKKVHEARRFISRGGQAMPEQLDPPGSGPDPLDALIDEETRVRLREALRRLSSRCKQLIRLRLAGHTTEEIAEALQTGRGAMYVLKHRCMQRLMKEYQ
jgi:RNA polymerase sigma factor (sigma-70 family)